MSVVFHPHSGNALRHRPMILKIVNDNFTLCKWIQLVPCHYNKTILLTCVFLRSILGQVCLDVLELPHVVVHVVSDLGLVLPLVDHVALVDLPVLGVGLLNVVACGGDQLLPQHLGLRYQLDSLEENVLRKNENR